MIIHCKIELYVFIHCKNTPVFILCACQLSALVKCTSRLEGNNGVSNCTDLNRVSNNKYHIKRCAHSSGQSFFLVRICATEYWQLVTTCTYANLSRVNTLNITLLFFSLRQHTTNLQLNEETGLRLNLKINFISLMKTVKLLKTQNSRISVLTNLRIFFKLKRIKICRISIFVFPL